MIYRFDQVDETLELLPMAARRALDHAGRRLSREGWASLPVPLRRQIVAFGAAPGVDIDLVREAMAVANPPPEELPSSGDPPADHVPSDVRTAFGPQLPLADAVWVSLTPLDRYALKKVASRGRTERMAEAYAEIVGHTAVSTHVAPEGGVRMVDVGEKTPSQRHARAESIATLGRTAFDRLRANDVPKGDVLATARVAAILAAKRTPELIPLCHDIALSKINVEFEFDSPNAAVRVLTTVEAQDRTGVEMEALVAASVASLTIYDMLKSIDRGIVIGPTRLLEKSGGRTGDFSR